MSHDKLPQLPLQKMTPLLKSPILIKFTISFSFNEAFILMYKYLCFTFNKSVFNWTFRQLLCLRKTKLHENYDFPGLKISPVLIRKPLLQPFSGVNVIKLSSPSPTLSQNKLECLSQ
jgi:hypothetical protein